MARGAVQSRGDCCRNVVGYLGLGTAILQPLRRVGTAMANIATGRSNQRVLHGSRREGRDCRPVVHGVTSIARN